MGLLPEIARDLNVSIPVGGRLISAYAMGVMVGAPAMTLLVARLRQKSALILLLAIFVGGNALATLSPGFYSLMASRIITSLSHGAYFGIGAVLASSLVTPDRSASAIASMLLGLTIANVGGVPAATWLGQTIGWRATFGSAAGLGIVALFVLQAALPQGQMCGKPNVRQELLALIRPATLTAFLTTAAGAGAIFTTYTYIAPMIHDLAGFSGNLVTWALVAIGVGFTLGNWIGGRFADSAAETTLFSALIALAVVSAALPLLLSGAITTLLALTLWGTAAFAVVPPVQTVVMRRAADAPGLASSVNIGAFNLGNAIGAVVGGLMLSGGLGFRAVSPAGAVLALMGVPLLFFSRPP